MYLVESLKLNKDVKGLAKYVSEHVPMALNTVDKHKIKKVVEFLLARYRRTRLEKLEELVS